MKPFPKEESQPREPVTKAVNAEKIVKVTIGLALFVIVVSVLVWQVNSVFQKVRGSWTEIVFAYEKPQIVKSLREDYLIRASQLEQQFLVRELSPEQKLLKEVADQLGQSKK